MKGFSYVLILVNLHLILVLRLVCLSFDDLLVKPCILQHSFAVVNAWGLELWVCGVPVVDVLEQDSLSLIKIVLNLLKTGNSALNEVILLVDRYETGDEVRILEAAKRFGEGNILLDLVKLCAGLEDVSSTSFGRLTLWADRNGRNHVRSDLRGHGGHGGHDGHIGTF